MGAEKTREAAIRLMAEVGIPERRSPSTSIPTSFRAACASASSSPSRSRRTRSSWSQTSRRPLSTPSPAPRHRADPRPQPQPWPRRHPDQPQSRTAAPERRPDRGALWRPVAHHRRCRRYRDAGRASLCEALFACIPTRDKELADIRSIPGRRSAPASGSRAAPSRRAAPMRSHLPHRAAAAERDAGAALQRMHPRPGSLTP